MTRTDLSKDKDRSYQG